MSKLHPESTELFQITVTADTNLAAATLHVRIGGPEAQWVPWEWAGESEKVPDKDLWVRVGERLIAGPDVSDAPEGAIQLVQDGLNAVDYRLTGLGLEKPAGSSESITVSR